MATPPTATPTTATSDDTETDTETDSETSVPVDQCDACLHNWSTHDAIARRFCQATIATALSRGCVCSV